MESQKDISNILRWNRYNAVLITIGLICSLYFSNVVFLALVSFLTFSYYIKANWKTLQALSPFGGYANWITFFRFLLLMTAMISWNIIPNILLISILILFVCLDGLDGWVARMQNQTTVFGQYFDMELDALFVLTSCVMLYVNDITYIWILLPGILRYFFVLFTWILGPKKVKEERTSYGATIAVVFFISLLISLAFQNSFQSILLVLSGFSIIVSFCISFYKYGKA